MNKIIKHRLESLKAEYEAGQKLLTEYEAKQQNLRETLLRISGAIQVLEEVLAEENSELNGEVSILSDSPAEMESLGELAASGEGT